MKISNVNSNIADFFRKNGKKWVCTAVTALMLSTPAIAKSEKKKDDVKPSTKIEQIKDYNIEDASQIIIDIDKINESLTGDFSKDEILEDYLSGLTNQYIDKELIEDIINGNAIIKMTMPWKLANGEKNKYARNVIQFKFRNNSRDIILDNYEEIINNLKDSSINNKLVEEIVEIIDISSEEKSVSDGEITKDNDNQVVNLTVGDKRLQLRCSAEIISFGAIMIVVIVFLVINKIITGRFFK